VKISQSDEHTFLLLKRYEGVDVFNIGQLIGFYRDGLHPNYLE
jgi:hypothetical protein